MKKLDEKQILPEIKRRIRTLLTNIVDSECKPDAIVLNDTHSIHFTIRNKDYLLKGTITKRVI